MMLYTSLLCFIPSPLPWLCMSSVKSCSVSGEPLEWKLRGTERHIKILSSSQTNNLGTKHEFHAASPLVVVQLRQAHIRHWLPSQTVGPVGCVAMYLSEKELPSNNVTPHPTPHALLPPLSSLHLLLDCSWRWNTEVQRARWAVVQSSALWELRVLSLCRCCGTLPVVRMHDYIVYMIVAYIESVFATTTTKYHLILYQW